MKVVLGCLANRVDAFAPTMVVCLIRKAPWRKLLMDHPCGRTALEGWLYQLRTSPPGPVAPEAGNATPVGAVRSFSVPLRFIC
jgi:hypothetical protein